MNFAKSRLLFMTSVGANYISLEDVDNLIPGKSTTLRMVFFCFIVTLPLMTPGMTTSFSSIALPQMKLNLDEASWFGSIVSITCPVGCLFTGLLIDRYGARASIICSMVPDLIGWFLMVDENASLTQLYLGRLLTGFALGACSLPCMVYAAECITINDVHVRGSVGAWSTVSMSIGCLLVYILGAILPYNRVALVSGFLSSLSLLSVLLLLPDSPMWLYRNGRTGDAEIAQLRLGIKQPILHSREIPAINLRPDSIEYSLRTLMNCLGRLRGREVYKPLVISIFLFFFSQFSGLYCLQGYMVDVITVYPLDVDPYVLAIISGALQVVGGVLSVLILPYSGVRMLTITSFLATAAGFFVLAACLLLENTSTPNIFNRIHVMSVWVVELVGNLGLVPIAYSILAEIFPAEAKGFASLSLFASSAFNFVALKIFPYMLARYTYKNLVFFMFAFLCVCGSVFVTICLPETVGKTMDEIEEDFKRSKQRANLDSGSVHE